MAASAEELLEEIYEKQLELVRAKRGSAREEELEKRLAALEARLEEKPKGEVEEAYEELTDEEEQVVARALADHRAGRQTASESLPEASEEPEPRKRTRPGMKRGMAYTVDPDTGRKLDHAFVYGGEDEPDRVELADQEEDVA